MKVGFVFPYAKDRLIDMNAQIEQIYSLDRPEGIDIDVYPSESNETQTNLYKLEKENFSAAQEIWEKIRLAREKGQSIALRDRCDWVIHHDMGTIFSNKYLHRLKETLESGMSYHYSDFSYLSRFNKYSVVQPVYSIDMSENKNFTKGMHHTNIFWANVWANRTKERYYYVRRGTNWIWNKKVIEKLDYKIEPQSDEIRRHDSVWREKLPKIGKMYHCILDTKLRVLDNTDKEAAKKMRKIKRRIIKDKNKIGEFN